MHNRLYDPRFLQRHGNDCYHNRPLHSDQMKILLGLPPKAKLPAEGMDPCYIQGVRVWVNPLPPHGNRMHAGFHRVRAQCPHCGEDMSAGRLNQHVCNDGAKAAWAMVTARHFFYLYGEAC